MGDFLIGTNLKVEASDPVWSSRGTYAELQLKQGAFGILTCD